MMGTSNPFGGQSGASPLVPSWVGDDGSTPGMPNGAGPDGQPSDGAGTDGQILVWHDLLGLYPGKTAKFVKNFLEGNPSGIQGALEDYATQVKQGTFPSDTHSYD